MATASVSESRVGLTVMDDTGASTTATVRCVLTPSTEAETVVRPASTPVTTPAPETRAIVASADDQVAREDETKLVVVVVPDSGRGYLSKVFNDDWMAEHGYSK